MYIDTYDLEAQSTALKSAAVNSTWASYLNVPNPCSSSVIWRSLFLLLGLLGESHELKFVGNT